MTSCGLIEKWKTPEQPTDSNSSTTSDPSSDATAATTSETDDLFSKTMNETSEETPLNAGSDAPSNIETQEASVKDDLKSLEDEFSGKASTEVATNKSNEEIKEVKVEESLPEIKEETVAIADNANMDAGKVMSYKVQKGETLMQIAFKIYGDLSKWKSIKNMNSNSLNGNTALRAGMVLKYTAPERLFVWNPEGSPHMIKTGETLGTISNAVYQTPKKWKNIWENNKPLIKNPNVIYAGFTLYYKSAGMANYVQPKALQKKTAAKMEKAEVQQATTEIETVKVDQAIAHEALVDNTSEVQAAPARTSASSNERSSASEEISAEDLKDDLEFQELEN